MHAFAHREPFTVVHGDPRRSWVWLGQTNFPSHRRESLSPTSCGVMLAMMFADRASIVF